MQTFLACLLTKTCKIPARLFLTKFQRRKLFQVYLQTSYFESAVYFLPCASDNPILGLQKPKRGLSTLGIQTGPFVAL